MITETQIIQSLRDYIQTTVSLPATTITLETALIEAGLIDSLSIFKLILFIEEHFVIKIQPEDIVVENFETINSLKALVQSKL